MKFHRVEIHGRGGIVAIDFAEEANARRCFDYYLKRLTNEAESAGLLIDHPMQVSRGDGSVRIEAPPVGSYAGHPLMWIFRVCRYELGADALPKQLDDDGWKVGGTFDQFMTRQIK